MTYEVRANVRTFKSEIGILYLNEFNQNVLTKLFRESSLEFHSLFECRIYVYLWKGNPLAEKQEITMEELADYPCLSFEQGSNNSFYFAEEVLSTYEYKRIIKANDRATIVKSDGRLKWVYSVLWYFVRGTQRFRLYCNSAEIR